MLESNRKFRDATIKGLMWISGSAGLDVSSLAIFEKHGHNIRELTLADSLLISATMWCQLLSTMPKLEKLKITSLKALVIQEDANITEKPTLNKLKTVELTDARCDLLPYIKNCQLKSLKIYTRFPDPQPRELLLNFLATQLELEELTLESHIYEESNLFKAPIPEGLLPFQLKKLSLLGDDHSALNEYSNNLMAFMRMHTNTLEELVLHRHFPAFFFEFVFNEFKQLRALSLMEHVMPRDSSFYHRLEANTSVISLKLGNPYWDENKCAFKSLIDHLPNIVKMELVEWCQRSIITHIAQYLEKLKEITIKSFNGRIFERLNFHALECLHIDVLSGPVNWTIFTRNNPTIKNLSIKLIDKRNYLDIQAVTQNLKLHKLTIEDGEFCCDENFFDVIRRNCKDLKCLELNAKGLKVDISSVADISGLIFHDY